MDKASNDFNIRLRNSIDPMIVLEARFLKVLSRYFVGEVKRRQAGR